MASHIECLIFILLKSTFFMLITVKVYSKSAPCDSGEFFDTEEEKCKKCSICPTNHIIDTDCTSFADLKCTFYAFKDFPNFDTGLDLNADFQSSINNIDNAGTSGKNDMASKNAQTSLDNELTTVENENEYWKTLAFALIGLLSALIIATFIILIFVYRKLQKSIVIQQSEEGDLMDDADSGYVVIRSIHHLTTPRGDNPFLSLYQREPPDVNPPLLPSSGLTSVDSGRPADSLSLTTPVATEGDKLNYLPKVYQPQRRMLNYDADDVFESDDNTSMSHRIDAKEKFQPLMGESNA